MNKDKNSDNLKIMDGCFFFMFLKVIPKALGVGMFAN